MSSTFQLRFNSTTFPSSSRFTFPLARTLSISEAAIVVTMFSLSCFFGFLWQPQHPGTEGGAQASNHITKTHEGGLGGRDWGCNGAKYTASCAQAQGAPPRSMFELYQSHCSGKFFSMTHDVMTTEVLLFSLLLPVSVPRRRTALARGFNPEPPDHGDQNLQGLRTRKCHGAPSRGGRDWSGVFVCSTCDKTT